MNGNALEGMEGKTVRIWFGEFGQSYEQGKILTIVPEKKVVVIERGNHLLAGKDWGTTRKIIIDTSFVNSVKILR